MQRWILGGCYPKGDGKTSVEVVGGVCFIVFIYQWDGGGGGGGGGANLVDRDESGRCCL